MLKVEGADPGVLNRRMRHHAEQLRPMIDALTYSLVFESSFAKDDEVHVIRQSRTGPGSFAFHPADGREFHFRMSRQASLAIDVLDSYQGGNVIATLHGDEEARRFIRKLSKARAPRVPVSTP
jgi:hypothetical protein